MQFEKEIKVRVLLKVLSVYLHLPTTAIMYTQTATVSNLYLKLMRFPASL